MKLLERLKINFIVKSREEYKRTILSLLERNESASLLDLGSGDYQRLTLKAAKVIQPRSTTCVDLSDIGRPGGKGLIYCRGDLNSPILLESGSFDVVIASQIVEHLWNTDGFLKEIYRVLKPTGYAIISTPCLDAWPNILYLILGRQPETAKVSEEMYPDHERPGHLRIFAKSELIKLLKFHGFWVEKVVGSGCILGRPTTVTVKAGK